MNSHFEVDGIISGINMNVFKCLGTGGKMSLPMPMKIKMLFDLSALCTVFLAYNIHNLVGLVCLFVLGRASIYVIQNAQLQL